LYQEGVKFKAPKSFLKPQKVFKPLDQNNKTIKKIRAEKSKRKKVQPLLSHPSDD
jgi:hypothetical protein